MEETIKSVLTLTSLAAHHYFTTFKNDRLIFKLLVALCTMLAVADAACNADWSYIWTGLDPSSTRLHAHG